MKSVGLSHSAAVMRGLERRRCAQPFTKADLDRGESIVKRLHGVEGFEAWAELIAKELAAERERNK